VYWNANLEVAAIEQHGDSNIVPMAILRARKDIEKDTEILTRYWHKEKDAWQNLCECQCCACTNHTGTTITTPTETANTTTTNGPGPVFGYTPRATQDSEIAPTFHQGGSHECSARAKEDHPESEMNDYEWDDLEHGTHNVATNLTVRTRQTSETPRSNKDPLLTSQLHHIHEGEERKREDDYSDREMDNLDWDVLGHPPNRDTITECESTGPPPTSLTCEQRQAYSLLCPANCRCKNSMPWLAEKSRVVKDYGLRNGNAELISNTCIAVGEIVAVFGETATIWAQDDVREFEHIATQQNAIESEVQKQDYPDSEMDDRDWDKMEASLFKKPPPQSNGQQNCFHQLKTTMR